MQKSEKIILKIAKLIEKDAKYKYLIIRPTYFNSYRKIFDGYEIFIRYNNPVDSEKN